MELLLPIVNQFLPYFCSCEKQCRIEGVHESRGFISPSSAIPHCFTANLSNGKVYKLAEVSSWLTWGKKYGHHVLVVYSHCQKFKTGQCLIFMSKSWLGVWGWYTVVGSWHDLSPISNSEREEVCCRMDAEVRVLHEVCTYLHFICLDHFNWSTIFASLLAFLTL